MPESPRPIRRRASRHKGQPRMSAAWLLVPFCFPLAALVSFYATNAAELEPTQMLAPLGEALLLVAVVTLVALAVLRSVARTVVLVSMLAAVYFYYGHLYSAAQGLLTPVLRLSLGRDTVLIAAIVIAIGAAVVTLFRSGERTVTAVKTFAVIGLALVATASATGIVAGVGATASEPAEEAVELPAASQEATASAETTSSGVDAEVATATAASAEKVEEKDTRPPDIYYIVLDGYASNQSLLNAATQFDNSGFTGFLEEQGFYVAPESKANYSQTFLCLASILNMKYVNDDFAGIAGKDRSKLYQMVWHNKVVKLLKAKDYRYVHIASGWGATNNSPHADEVLTSESSELREQLNSTTMFRPLANRSLSKHKYRAVKDAFAQLGSVESQKKRPTFTFAHILAPHGPYVFKADGSLAVGSSTDMSNWRPSQIDNYTAQLQAINRLTIRLVKRLVAERDRPLIVIIQGDHGTSFPAKTSAAHFAERHSVLNAMYFSEGAPEELHESISPVNTFRVVLNESIGTRYPLLEDRCYTSQNYDNPYEVTDRTEQITGAWPSAPPSSQPANKQVE